MSSADGGGGMRPVLKPLLAGAAVAALAGCAVGPNYQPPKAEGPASFVAAAPSTAAQAPLLPPNPNGASR